MSIINIEIISIDLRIVKEIHDDGREFYQQAVIPGHEHRYISKETVLHGFESLRLYQSHAGTVPFTTLTKWASEGRTFEAELELEKVFGESSIPQAIYDPVIRPHKERYRTEVALPFLDKLEPKEISDYLKNNQIN